MWGETYSYAMCVMEEMQWIRTKSVKAAEFFHGTLELLEKDGICALSEGKDLRVCAQFANRCGAKAAEVLGATEWAVQKYEEDKL